MCAVFPWCSELRERVAGRLSWRGSSPFCDISRDIDPMRLDLPATTGLLRARTGSSLQFECTRNLIERRLLRFAYAHAADAKKSAFLRCLGNVLADLAQPALEGCCIAGRLGIHHCASLPQRLDALGFDLTRLAACALLRPSAVSKSATTALISASAPGSNLAVISALPSAKLSFRRPHRPLGSAAEMAIPAVITLSRRSFHSSGVKFDLSGMAALLYLSSRSARLRLLLHQPSAPRRRLMHAAGKSQAVSSVSFARRASIVGFNSSAT